MTHLYRAHAESTRLTPAEVTELTAAAVAAADTAYARYSDFRVGAAVRTDRRLYRGANIENASFSLGLCAERTALARAVTDGYSEILAIAVACVSAPATSDLSSLMPCGACRQWLAEFAEPGTEIFICGPTPELSPLFTLAELMPIPFTMPPRPTGG